MSERIYKWFDRVGIRMRYTIIGRYEVSSKLTEPIFLKSYVKNNWEGIGYNIVNCGDWLS